MTEIERQAALIKDMVRRIAEKDNRIAEKDNEIERLNREHDQAMDFLAARDTEQGIEIEHLRAALEMIAGKRQCLDNLMSDKDIARKALEGR